MNRCDHLKGREWIEQGYLPQLSGRVLWVGVADYTKHYYTLVQEPAKFETVDIAPMREKWGSPGNHTTVDFLQFQTDRRYDHVAVYGLDPKYLPADQASWLAWSEKLIRKAGTLLVAGGTLLFGGYTTRHTASIFMAVEEYKKLFVREVEITGKNCLKLWVQKRKS